MRPIFYFRTLFHWKSEKEIRWGDLYGWADVPRLTESVSCEICIHIYKLCPTKVHSSPIFLTVKMSCNERIWDIYAEYLSINNCKCYKILSKFAIHSLASTYKHVAYDSNLFNSETCIELFSNRNQGDKNITNINSDYMYPQIEKSDTKFCWYLHWTYEYLVKKYVFL